MNMSQSRDAITQTQAEAQKLGYRLEWDPVSGAVQLFKPVEGLESVTAVRQFLRGVRRGARRRLAMEQFRETP